MAPSSDFTASSATSSISLTWTLLLSSYEDLVMTQGPQGIQSHLYFRVLDLFLLSESLYIMS